MTIRGAHSTNKRKPRTKNSPDTLVQALGAAANLKEMGYMQTANILALAAHSNAMAIGDLSEMLNRQNGGDHE